jgi:hypothetical protein
MNRWTRRQRDNMNKMTIRMMDRWTMNVQKDAYRQMNRDTKE